MLFSWQKDKLKYCIDIESCKCNDNGNHYCTKRLDFEYKEILKLKLDFKKASINDFLSEPNRSIVTGNGFNIFNLKNNDYTWKNIETRAKEIAKIGFYYSEIEEHKAHLRSTLVVFDLFCKETNYLNSLWNELFKYISSDNNPSYANESYIFSKIEIEILQTFNHNLSSGWSYEVLMFINDIMNPSPQDQTKRNAYNHFKYYYSIALQEAIWFNGFLMQPLKNIILEEIDLDKYKKLINGQIYTFNFDGLTSSIFNKRANHINGSFDYVIKANKDRSEPIDTVGLNLLLKNIIDSSSYLDCLLENNYTSSIVLKSPLYKETHKFDVCQFKDYYDTHNKIIDDYSAFLIFGCSLIGDLTYFNILFTLKKVYFVYHDMSFDEAREYITSLEFLNYLTTGANIKTYKTVNLISSNELDKFLKKDNL